MAGPTQSHQVVLYRVGHFLLSTGVLPIIPSSGTLQGSTSALVDFAPHSTANEPPIIPSSGTLQWRPIRLTPRTRLIIMVVVKPQLIRTHSSGATQIPSSGTLPEGPYLFASETSTNQDPLCGDCLPGTFPIKWYNPTRDSRPLPFRGTFPIKWYNPIRGTSPPWYLSHQVVQSHRRHNPFPIKWYSQGFGRFPSMRY